ncbi:MAG: 3-deoxy-manno-octulosonate cytidylyltransferase [Prevotella sp.]|nr:3-deoxy-manno-octulosonate cytidylyltransferase [Prevotella sp.]
MKFISIIPARYASTRFPGKPLADLGGKSVIQHVYERVSQVIENVYVATDDERIFRTVNTFGGKAIMTRSDHRSGTDRICEALEKVRSDENNGELVVINVQGDEPFIRPEQIETLCGLFDTDETHIATLATHFNSPDDAKSPNSPKIVTDKRGFALYFSRSVIPFVREAGGNFPYLKHIGIYAYRADVLREIAQLPPSPLEKAESLEQLRWLENGYRIRVGLTSQATIGIDTPADLEKARQLL